MASVDNSLFLKNEKPVIRTLMNRLFEEFEYASILVSDSVGRKYMTSAQGITINEDSLLTFRGYVVKVYNNGRFGEYSFNELSENVIDSIVDNIRNITPTPADITVNTYEAPLDEKAEYTRSTEFQQDPVEMGDEVIIGRLNAIRQKGISRSDKVLDCRAYSTYQICSKYFLSNNRELEQNFMWMTGNILVLAARGEELQKYFKSYSNLGGAEVLDKMENDVENIADCAVELLDAKPMVPGEYDCICTPEVTGMIVHEAFGHGVEMDMFVKKRALAEKYIGEYVASPLVTMHDGAAAATEVASYFFDDEGMDGKDTVIIDKGILKTGINDMQTSMNLKIPPTGNGRRQDYERKAYTRMTNTYFEAGKDKVEDMIASIEHGFLLENATSGMEDPKNWGIQCMVNVAREIENGKFTGKVFSPIVLTGYVPDLLKSISMVSDKMELGGGGFCGKGYKEWAKVSDGGPYIKARIRLG